MFRIFQKAIISYRLKNVIENEHFMWKILLLNISDWAVCRTDIGRVLSDT